MKIRKLKAWLEEQTLLQPARYYKELVGGKHLEKLTCPNPEHEDSTPSFNWNGKEGYFKCFGCNWKGKSPVALYILLHPHLSINEILERFYDRFFEPVIPISVVKNYEMKLRKRKDLIDKLWKERRIGEVAIKKYRLGWDGERFTVPVFNEFELCVDIRRCALLKSLRLPQAPKVLGYKKGYGKVRLIGTQTISDKNRAVFYVEGEPDMLSLASYGFNVITNTNGVNAWKDEWLKWFAGRKVVVVSDVGAEDATLRKAKLISRVASVKMITFKGQPEGFDINDYIVQMDDSKVRLAIAELVKQAKTVKPDKSTPAAPQFGEREISFQDIVSSEFFQQRISFRAFVTGKSMSPYLVAKRARIICKHPVGIKKCDTCPLKEEYVLNIEPYSQDFLRLFEARDDSLLSTYANLAGAPRMCRQRLDVNVDETYNVNVIKITHPQELITTDEHRDQLEILAHVVGNIEVSDNTDYTFSGMTVQHPKTQQVAVIIDRVTEGDNPLDIDSLSEDFIERVRSQFVSYGNSVRERVRKNVELVAQATGIVGRNDMIEAMLLCYHTVRSFVFANQKVERGTGDILFIGDTRTGKTELVSSFIRAVGIGRMIQAETTSFAGIMGGAESLRHHRWMASWGVIPTNNKKLVVIDEASKLTKAEIAKLRGVRSSALAQIHKISVSVSTPANTRLIWICNPRNGQTMAEFAYGIQSVHMLTNDPADIARFDAVVVVRSDEVEQSKINIRRSMNKELLNGFASRIRWIWSLNSSHVSFTNEAEENVFKLAIKLNEKYRSDISLFESDSYIKVARLAIAYAALSLDSVDGKKIIVTKEHVDEVERFYSDIYDKKAASFDEYAHEYKRANDAVNADVLENLMKKRARKRQTVIISQLMRLNRFSEVTLARIFGVGKNEVDDIVNALYVANAIVVDNVGQSIYKKTAAFAKWLSEKRREVRKK